MLEKFEKQSFNTVNGKYCCNEAGSQIINNVKAGVVSIP